MADDRAGSSPGVHALRLAPRRSLLKQAIAGARRPAYQPAMAVSAAATPALFDRALLRARQARARKQGEVTFLLDRVAEDMADRISTVKREFADVADIWSPGEAVAG